ncbi:AMP-binding protein [Companilactobacillus allii]|uniref:Acyl-CoA synthetase n=1 Tax=Companilactobacillus allii TaxID=1847728 RepID=A0A1P8Q1T4_9LACO|nr:AMP-binding protein [Companilactobacillus allii]APX71795.1 acyl-CoA synthetase [Companilactobacillus allii]USQ68882.1 AMP-binding protein [Companilactobacillus allii]
MSKITNQLNQQLKKNSENLIIKDESRGLWFSGEEIKSDVDIIKNSLMDLRVGHGDVVLVCLENNGAYPVIVQAIWEVGAVVHPISDTTPAIELQQELTEHQYAAAIVKDDLTTAVTENRAVTIVDDSLVTALHLTIIRDQNIVGHMDQIPTENDLALIMNTSGTTGKPKGVGITHELLKNAVDHDIESHEMTQADTTMIVMPMFHINAQAVSMLSTRLSGGRIVITKKFSASRFWNQVRENGVTWVSVVPTIVNILLINKKANEAYADDIKLRFVRCSSFALPLDKLTSFQNRFHTIILEGYGMTETASQCTINPFDAPKVGSAGKPFKTELGILINDKFTKEANQVGEIAVRGDHVIKDYMEPHPDSFRKDWFLTGDLGYLDEDGYLFVKGRKKDIISRGGEKVAPAHVENALSQLDCVKEVAVIGTPDELYGEAVTAVIIRQDNQRLEDTRQDILNHAKKSLAVFEQPTKVIFVDDYPRNATGKVLRVKLRNQILEEAESIGA